MPPTVIPPDAPLKSRMPMAVGTAIVAFLVVSLLARWLVFALGLAGGLESEFGAQEWAIVVAIFLAALCGTLVARGRFLVWACVLWFLPLAAVVSFTFAFYPKDQSSLSHLARLLLPLVGSTLAATLLGVQAGKLIGRQWAAWRVAGMGAALPADGSAGVATAGLEPVPVASAAMTALGQWWRIVLTFTLAGPPIGSLATLAYYSLDAANSGAPINWLGLMPAALVFALYSFGVGLIPAFVVGLLYAGVVVRGDCQRGNAIGRVLFATALGAAVGALISSLGFSDRLWLFLPCLIATPACAWLSGRHARERRHRSDEAAPQV